jgi:signal transduction histidine kinase
VKSLYLRIYLTVVAVLLLFALVSGWVWHGNLERARIEGREPWRERLGAWAELAEQNLPAPMAPAAEQGAALLELSQRLRLPLALDAASGERIAASEDYLRYESRIVGGAEAGRPARHVSLPLADGRTLWVLRPGGPTMMRPLPPLFPGMPPSLQPSPGAGLVVSLVVLFGAISLGAYPVVRRLTRRLEALKQGVEAFGGGALNRRVAAEGNDEIAAVAASFNRAAERIEVLVGSHRTLLANASHELRSPLARLKMALAMLDDAPPAEHERLRGEIENNVAELDALVDEVLLASRLDATAPDANAATRVDLLGLAAEEAARFDAELSDAQALSVDGDERLLRRALRNLLENARRHGGGEISIATARRGGRAIVRVCDRGPGVPEAARERIFEPFYRLPGRAEEAGGVGLGLSLVKQIAERHGGGVRCTARDGGGSCFELDLPAVAPAG